MNGMLCRKQKKNLATLDHQEKGKIMLFISPLLKKEKKHLVPIGQNILRNAQYIYQNM